MSWWTPDRQAYALNYLVNYGGLSPYGAAGLVSRWINVESSGGPASVNPYSGAFGIGQWLGTRKSPINGNTGFDAQLAYVVQELNTGSDGSGGVAANLLRAATDAQTAATGASAYERAEGSRQLFPRDNYTNKTAAGVGAVLANWQGAAQAARPLIFQAVIDAHGNMVDAGGGAPVAVGIGLGTVALIGGSLLLLYLLHE